MTVKEQKVIRDRKAGYQKVVPEIESLVADETDLVANLSNIVGALKQAFGFFWVGFYVSKDSQLVLGPFQGPVACTRIDFDSGVCGHCYSTKQPVIVPDVHEFPGHIACSTESRSEIVVPLITESGEILGVLDVDSDEPDYFSETDSEGLSKVAEVAAGLWPEQDR